EGEGRAGQERQDKGDGTHRFGNRPPRREARAVADVLQQATDVPGAAQEASPWRVACSQMRDAGRRRRGKRTRGWTCRRPVRAPRTPSTCARRGRAPPNRRTA